ncbi:MAG TPA: S49 family peptidase [bacterium]|jgi:protease-4
MQRFSAVLVACVLTLGLCLTALAQGNRSDFPNYGAGSEVLSATPSTQGGAAAGFWNPAAFAAMQKMEAAFSWNDQHFVRGRLNNWGLFLGGSGVGFSVRRNDFFAPSSTALTGLSAQHVDDYQIAVGGGDPGQYWGLSYNWARGAGRQFESRDEFFSLGNIYRPFNFLSIGNTGSLGIHHGDYRGISDVGIRPLMNHRLTVFGDAAYAHHDTWRTLQWGAGLELWPVNGVRLAGKVSKPFAHQQDKLYTLSVGLSLDGIGFHVVPHYVRQTNTAANGTTSKKTERASVDYMLRLGQQEPGLNTQRLFERNKRVVSLPLKGRMTYQSFVLFDKERFPLLEMQTMIEKAKHDKTVSGIAMNLSGFSGPSEMLWEVREKLQDFKSSGKKVYVYFDRAGMAEYQFASVADYVWMDPQGQIAIPGYVASRTYYKGLLEKIGLGVQEWRFFAYKSAFESFSRKNMSEKDREQRLALITDFYNQWQGAVAESRHLSPEAVRANVDTMVVFSAQTARTAGLIDTVGRWEDASDLVEKISGKKPEFVTKEQVTMKRFADQAWGEPPKVAVVYAIGDCDMDIGIRGRYTSTLLHKLATQKDIKAVVLRVDSPGGDALPSDLVAQQMKEVSKKKPMIVSQGSVAASGGYWLSMNGDRIFASPRTITGSIGVIGGWIWNEKFTDKTGFTEDHTQIGEHADLTAGVTLPLIGATIPNRNLTDYEFAKMKKLIVDEYTEFTQKVADGRKLEQAYVDSIGQGRVWSGTRALDLKLVDQLGGLDDALVYARTQAHLPARGSKVKVVEFPKRGLLNPAALGGGSPMPMRLLALILGKEQAIDLATSDDYELKVLTKMAEHPGQALFMIPPEDLPTESKR